MARSCSHLRELASLYFHQDYDREYADADSALRDFASGYDVEFLVATMAEIDTVLAEVRSEEELKVLWLDACGAYFEPETVGLTYRGWFEHMLQILRDMAS